MNEQKRILIVDDDEALTDVLGDKLREAGYTVVITHDGAEGLAKAIEIHPDLILLDMKMPKMDGLTMLANLRKDPWGERARVVMLTLLDQEESVAKAIELHATEYFLKTGWSMDEIVEKIKENLSI